MPFPGNTPAGAEFNRQSSNLDGLRSRKKRTKIGVIKKVVGSEAQQGVYTVILDIIGPNGSIEMTTKPIPLKEHPLFIAQTYGPPEELPGAYMCQVEYDGVNINNGVATFARDIFNDKEVTEQANIQAVKGSAFCPPGGLPI